MPTENKPTKRSNGRVPQQYPVPKNEEEQKEIGDRMKKLIPIYEQSKVKSDEELEQRFAWYYRYCAEVDLYPTVEAMFMACGYDRDWLYNLENGRAKGFSPDTVGIVKKAKSFMSVYDAQMVVSGKLNPVVYIFRSKNYYGMKDQQDVTVSAVANDNVNAEDIKNRYIQENYPIETTAKEVKEE